MLVKMRKTIEYTGANHRVSEATVELLSRERNKGKTLRQLGQISGRSHETIRQLLAKHGRPQVTLLSERTVVAKLGYPVQWLTKLRKEGIINPIKPGGLWLYSEEQVRQLPSLITEARKCQQCGKPRPPGSRRFCRECSQYRRKHTYQFLSPEKKAEHTKMCLAWQRANKKLRKTIEYAGSEHRVSEATIELLSRERNKGKTLRQLGQMFGRSYERVRILLAKYDRPQVTLLPENTAAAKLGYPVEWLTKLRKEGIVKPIKPGGFWLYSEEQARQLPSLITEARKCQQCGKPRPPGSRRFCRECSQYRRKHRLILY